MDRNKLKIGINFWKPFWKRARHPLKETAENPADPVPVPDDAKIVSGSEYKTIKVWDIKTGHCLYSLMHHTDNIWKMRFNQSQIKSFLVKHVVYLESERDIYLI